MVSVLGSGSSSEPIEPAIGHLVGDALNAANGHDGAAADAATATTADPTQPASALSAPREPACASLVTSDADQISTGAVNETLSYVDAQELIGHSQSSQQQDGCRPAVSNLDADCQPEPPPLPDADSDSDQQPPASMTDSKSTEDSLPYLNVAMSPLPPPTTSSLSASCSLNSQQDSTTAQYCRPSPSPQPASVAEIAVSSVSSMGEVCQSSKSASPVSTGAGDNSATGVPVDAVGQQQQAQQQMPGGRLMTAPIENQSASAHPITTQVSTTSTLHDAAHLADSVPSTTTVPATSPTETSAETTRPSALSVSSGDAPTETRSASEVRRGIRPLSSPFVSAASPSPATQSGPVVGPAHGSPAATVSPSANSTLSTPSPFLTVRPGSAERVMGGCVSLASSVASPSPSSTALDYYLTRELENSIKSLHMNPAAPGTGLVGRPNSSDFRPKAHISLQQMVSGEQQLHQLPASMTAGNMAQQFYGPYGSFRHAPPFMPDHTSMYPVDGHVASSTGLAAGPGGSPGVGPGFGLGVGPGFGLGVGPVLGGPDVGGIGAGSIGAGGRSTGRPQLFNLNGSAGIGSRLAGNREPTPDPNVVGQYPGMAAYDGRVDGQLKHSPVERSLDQMTEAERDAALDTSLGAMALKPSAGCAVQAPMMPDVAEGLSDSEHLPGPSTSADKTSSLQSSRARFRQEIIDSFSADLEPTGLLHDQPQAEPATSTSPAGQPVSDDTHRLVYLAGPDGGPGRPVWIMRDSYRQMLQEVEQQQRLREQRELEQETAVRLRQFELARQLLRSQAQICQLPVQPVPVQPNAETTFAPAGRRHPAPTSRPNSTVQMQSRDQLPTDRVASGAEFPSSDSDVANDDDDDDDDDNSEVPKRGKRYRPLPTSEQAAAAARPTRTRPTDQHHQADWRTERIEGFGSSAVVSGSLPTSLPTSARRRQDGNAADYDTDEETDRLLRSQYSSQTGRPSSDQRPYGSHGPAGLCQPARPLPASSDDAHRYEAQRLLEERRRQRVREVTLADPDDTSVLLEGILFRARYLGSTQLLNDGHPSKQLRMMQAQEAVTRIKAPDGENQPSTDVDLFVSTEKLLVLNALAHHQMNKPKPALPNGKTELAGASAGASAGGSTGGSADGSAGDSPSTGPSSSSSARLTGSQLGALLDNLVMMNHPLRTISYIADIDNILVIMARRRQMISLDSGPDGRPDGTHPAALGNGATAGGSHGIGLAVRSNKILCHVFESDEAQLLAQTIGQAFQVAYIEFLKANGIEEGDMIDKSMDYQDVLNQQEIFNQELSVFSDKQRHKDVVVAKKKGGHNEPVVVESGWGSIVPTVVLANLNPEGPAARGGQLNIGDQILSVNGISMVGLPLATCQTHIKNTRNQNAVKLSIIQCPPVIEVLIRRPDVKYQLGFSVQNGVICSLLRGGIAERGGIRVGHRIIEINGQSVVAV